MQSLALPESCSYTKAPIPQEMEKDRQTIRQMLTVNAGAVRHSKDLEAGTHIVGKIFEKYQALCLNSKEAYEICNMAETAQMIFSAACARKESIGAHYLVD